MLVVVSLFDIDDPLVLLPLFIELLSVVLPVVELRSELLPVVELLLAEDGVLLVVPVAERVVLLPVVALPLVALPDCGPDVVVLLLGEPEAPPWPLALVPELEPPLLPCAMAPPHARAAAAEMARILRVCLMHYS